MAKLCDICQSAKAQVKRPKTQQQICKSCFYAVFELEIHNTIIHSKLFSPGDRIGIGASGGNFILPFNHIGKDSTVLAHIMTLLNARHSYGLSLHLLSIDEGIAGYRDDSLETVKRNQIQYDLPLTILSYKELYGWSMDEIVEKIGRKGNCTFCGVFRRQALDRGAVKMGLDQIVTGHNADDIAETVLMNILRGDIARLSRCTAIKTGGKVPEEEEEPVWNIPRSKPFKYTYEKEIVMYAYFKKLDYFRYFCGFN
jgi:cytoplasmic tRNA 2-thiolation protein 1